jgi:hypothetical protein
VLDLTRADPSLLHLVDEVVTELLAKSTLLGSSQVMLVGAHCRDILQSAFGHEFSLRVTSDIDLGLAVANWAAYDELTTRLPVTSVGATDAWAVGQLDPATVQDTTQPAMVHWNGTAWSVVAGPAIPGNGGYLRGVSARAANDVWAVGPELLSDTPYVAPLTEHWDGAQWTRVAAPSAGAPNIWAVSARPGTTHTWAVGTQAPVAPGDPLILERH